MTVTRICVVCEQPFQASYPNMRLCSDDCRTVRRRRTRARSASWYNRGRPNVGMICQWCGRHLFRDHPEGVICRLDVDFAVPPADAVKVQ